MLHGISVRLIHNNPLANITPTLKRLRDDGADSVAIIPHHYVYLAPGSSALAAPPPGWDPQWFIFPDHGQDPQHPFANTPQPEHVAEVCNAAIDLGLRVMLKPHIDSNYGAWRGDISVQTRAADWIWAYRNRFLPRYVDLARQLRGDPILCIGCELLQVTRELGADFWIGVVDWVRAQ